MEMSGLKRSLTSGKGLCESRVLRVGTKAIGFFRCTSNAGLPASGDQHSDRGTRHLQNELEEE